MTAGVPVGSSGPLRSPSPGKASRRNSPTTLGTSEGEHTSSREGYVTRARVEEVRKQLTQRDRAIVSDVGRVRVLSGQQIRQIHYRELQSSRRLARRDLARLTDLRVLGRLERQIGGQRAGSEGFVYTLDVLGQRLLYPDRKRHRSPWSPGRFFVDHALAVSELYVRLRLLTAPNKAQLRFDAEPEAWRTFSGPGGGQLILKPDAYLIWSTAKFEDSYFIEVDRSTESLPRITEKGRIYLRYWQNGREQAARDVFPIVLWIVPDDERQDRITEALRQLGEEARTLFVVATDEMAPLAIADGSATEAS